MAGKVLRAGVVGASTLLGKELISEIGSSTRAVWDLTLFDMSDEAEGQLTSVGDEAYVIRSLNAEAFNGLDLVFFVEDAAVAREYGPRAVKAGAAVVDLTRAMAGQPGFVLRSPWVEGGVRPDLTTVGAIGAHPAALMLAIVAERLTRRFGELEMAATVLEPASQAGAAGVDELHQQTVSLLSFQEVPKAVFDAQVAFNLQGALGAEAQVQLQSTRERIREEVRGLLGGTQGALALQLLQAPVFHGAVISAFVRLPKETDRDALRAALGSDPIASEDETAPSNQAATESGTLMVSIETQPGEERSAWLLLAADNLRLAARNAVGVALELAALRPADRVQ